MGKPRRDALRDIVPRTEVPALTNFIGAIIQAEQLGVSISKVLQVQSEQLRIERRQRAEEMAAKAPIKMLFPLVGCIFPSLFIVILGPAIILIIDQPGQRRRPAAEPRRLAVPAASPARGRRPQPRPRTPCSRTGWRRPARCGPSSWASWAVPSLPAGDGLWLPASNGIHMMFMRFPIDAVFVSKPGPTGRATVKSVHRRLRAWTGLVPLVRGADGVLELPVGTIDASGTAVGDRVEVVEAADARELPAEPAEQVGEVVGERSVTDARFLPPVPRSVSTDPGSLVRDDPVTDAGSGLRLGPRWGRTGCSSTRSPTASSAAADRRREVVVPIGHVHEEQSIVGQRAVRVDEGLGGQEMAGGRVRREGVHDQEINAAGRRCSRRAAGHRRCRTAGGGLRSARYVNSAGIARDARDERINLVERQVVLGPCVAASATGTESLDDDPARGLDRPTAGTYRRSARIVA